MKRYFTLLFTAALLALTTNCGNKRQNPESDKPGVESGFTIAYADSSTVNNLAVLCRVWGFVKYHHPAFYGKKGKNADAELFRLMPQVAMAAKEERNRIFSGWIDGLGEFEYDRKRYARYSETPYRLEIDPVWTKDREELGDTLSETLSSLRYAVRKGNNRYVKPLSPAVANPDFNGEDSYSEIQSPDAGYRLLALFRYWNAIEYFYPNKHLTDRDWDVVLTEYIGRFIECGSEGYHQQLAQLVTELNDSHAMLYPTYMPREAYIEVNGQFIEGRLIVTPSTPAELGKPIPSDAPAWPPLKFGDEIICVNGRSVDSIMQNVSTYVSCSNEAALRFRTSVYAFSSIASEKYEVVFLRDGKRDTVCMTPHTDPSKRIFTDFPSYELPGGYALIDDGIGYVDAALYSNSRSAEIMAALGDTKAIIIDLRRYPSDFMIFDFFGKYFVPEPVNHVIFTKPVYELPGCYREDRQRMGYNNPDYYKGTVIALVDSNTISQAEYTAMTVQALPKGITVGSTTMGADGNISEIPLPDGYITLISGLGVYYTDGSETQRCGIRIDYPVAPTVSGVREGRDEVLEKAIEIANSL